MNFWVGIQSFEGTVNKLYLMIIEDGLSYLLKLFKHFFLFVRPILGHPRFQKLANLESDFLHSILKVRSKKSFGSRDLKVVFIIYL